MLKSSDSDFPITHSANSTGIDDINSCWIQQSIQPQRQFEQLMNSVR